MELAVGLVDLWKLFRVQHLGLANETGAVVRQDTVVGFRQLLLCLQLLIHALANTRISTISTDKNIAVMGLVVRASNHDAVLVLKDRQDTLAHEDLVRRNLSSQ